MGAPWHVELSQDAVREVRDAPPVVQRSLAGLLDRLEREGLPPDARPLPGGGHQISRGDIAAVVSVDPDARSLMVARLTTASPSPARDALRVAHVPAVASSRLALYLDELGTDVKSSLRSFRRGPGFVVSVIATLALAIGGATALAGLAGTVFAGALPFEDDASLLRLRDRRVTAGGEPRAFNMAPLNFHAIREQNSTLDGVAAANGVNHVLTGGEVSQRVNALHVSEGWAELLGIRPVVGRLFTADEERLGSDAQVALISHSLWESRYGGDPGVVGSRVEYDGGILTVVGVLRPRFRYPYEADLWMPWSWDRTDGTSHDLNVVARMAEGVTLDQVRRDLDHISSGLRETRGDTNTDLFANVESLRDDFIRDGDQVLLALVAAVAFLLLLACVNVTNLFVARFVARRREVGIRVALGAGRVREVRGLMVETVLLFVSGGAVGLMLSVWLGDGMSALVPDAMRNELDMAGLRVSWELVAFALGLSLLAGLLAGLAAAWRGTRNDIALLLRDGGRTGSPGGTGVQRTLVVTQLALSLSLLVGAGILLVHFQRLTSDDLGLVVEDLYTLRVSMEQERFAEVDARAVIVGRLTETLEALPGVVSAAYTTVNPLCCGDWGAPLGVEGHPQSEGSTHLIHHRLVGPGYFETTGTPLLRGRDFDARDVPGSAPTVIVDAALAARFWPGEDAVGKRVRLDRPDSPWRTVVGVVGDVDEQGDYAETWYLPYTQDPLARSSENLHFMIRTGDASVLEHARRAFRSVDPNLAVYGLSSMAALRQDNISQNRLGAGVGGVFAAFGLLLAGLGVFGMVSYNVGTRSREIGTRIALGARPIEVVALILRNALSLTAVGALVGVVTSVGLSRVLEQTVFGLEGAGPGLMVGLSVVLFATSLTAAAVPALRASRVSPIEAFRD